MINNSLLWDKFTVLLSIYHKEEPSYLLQSLDSIFNQTVQPDEVVLVKDGPLTPELDAIIEDYCKKKSSLKVISLTQNLGLGKALNEGLKHCSHELVMRMDTDDIAKEYRFERQLEVFYRYPEVDVVSAWVDEFEGDISNVISVRKLPERHANIYGYAKRRSPVNHPSVAFKKSAVLAVGSYKHFPLFEDYYLWVRMLANGAKFYNIQESLVYFRISPDMFKRRGGWKYVMTEIKFEKKIWDIGFINSFELITNIGIRFIVRNIPNQLRAFIYKMIRNV